MQKTTLRSLSTLTPVRVALLALVALLAATTAQAQTFKVAVFDPQRVSEETAEGKRLATLLETMRDDKQSSLSAQEKEIGALQEQLKTQSLSLSADKRNEMALNIQRKLLQINLSKDLAERELQLEAASYQAAFNDKLVNAISQFGKDSDFAIILPVDAVAWASSSVDVTTAIIDAFDKMYTPASGN